MEATPASPTARPGVGLRIGAVLLALVLALVSAVAIVTMIDISDSQLCEDAVAGECYEFSGSIEPVVLAFGWAGGVIAGVAALMALAFAARGRGGRQLSVAIGIGAVALAVSIVAARAG